MRIPFWAEKLRCAYFQRRDKWQENLEEVRKRKGYKRGENGKQMLTSCLQRSSLAFGQPFFIVKALKRPVVAGTIVFRRIVLLSLLKHFLVFNQITIMQQHDVGVTSLVSEYEHFTLEYAAHQHSFYFCIVKYKQNFSSRLKCEISIVSAVNFSG